MAAPQRRIVLLGKTGAGKSSLANTILGVESVFGIYHGADSGTSECQTETREVHGRNITITDTPGLFDSKKSKREPKPAIIKCITECSPGPHAFLILLKVDRYTKQEKKVISKIKKYFSKKAFKHAVVVFTHGDQLPGDMRIEQFVGKNQKLRDLLEKCGGRCHVVDNNCWKNNQQDEYRNNQVQVEALLNTIDSMIEANREAKRGDYYTNKMFKKVEQRIKKAEELIRQIPGAENMSDEEIREQAKRHVKEDIKKKIAGVTTGMLLGALLGGPLMVAIVVSALKRIGPVGIAAAAEVVQAGTAAAVAGVAAGKGAAAAAVIAGAGTAAVGVAGAISGGVAAGVVAVGGAVIGGRTAYEEADKADSASEAVKNTAAALCNKIKKPFKK